MKIRKTVLMIAVTAGLLAMSGCVGFVAPPAGGGQDKVMVCHKGKKTLEVAAAAVDAHLRHGDTRGRCR